MNTSRGGISVVYVTHRETPRFDWFADALAHQARDDDFEVVIVDGLHSPHRTDAFMHAVGGRFACRHVAAKPTPYNGTFRLTRDDCFAAASARNTGIVCASRPYVVFADDVSVPLEGWWSAVRRAAASGYVVAGAYQKRRELVVHNGELVSSVDDPAGLDSRWAMGDDTRPVPIVGGQLFGCSFGASRDALVAVNGSDELCDPIGGEDWHLGFRLQWSGLDVLYDRRMLTVESQELHVGASLRRVLTHATPADYLARLRHFGLSARAVNGAHDSSYMICDLLFGLKTTQTIGNYYVLEELTEASLSALPAHFPRRYWFDDRCLSTL
jgi:hypothetical protein